MLWPKKMFARAPNQPLEPPRRRIVEVLYAEVLAEALGLNPLENGEEPPFLNRLPTNLQIDQKWPTTYYQIWCYTSWNVLISRTDTHTCLIYIITTFHMIWYAPWYLLIILSRNAGTSHITVSKYMLTDDIRRVTYISRNCKVRAFTWYAYSW